MLALFGENLGDALDPTSLLDFMNHVGGCVIEVFGKSLGYRRVLESYWVNLPYVAP